MIVDPIKGVVLGLELNLVRVVIELIHGHTCDLAIQRDRCDYIVRVLYLDVFYFKGSEDLNGE